MKTRSLILAAVGATALSLSGALAAAGPDINNGRLVALGGSFDQNGPMACARCHQLDGSGNSSGAFPRLTDQSAWYLYKTLKDFSSGLRRTPVMQYVAVGLTDAEMQDVAAYYASIGNAPYPSPPPDYDPQVLQIGGAIAGVGIPDQGVPACSSCHGKDGVGAPPIYPYLAGQPAPYIKRQLMLWKKGERDGDPLNVMEYVAKSMTDDQIGAVSEYFASVRPKQVTPDESLLLSLDQRHRAPTAMEGQAPEEQVGHAGQP